MPSLSSVFLFLTVIGGLAVLFQAVGAMIGLGSDTDSAEHANPDDAHHVLSAAHADSALSVFNFRSVRAIATGICFTGLGGLLALRTFDGLTATALGLLLGVSLYLFVAFVMRGFARLDADHSVHPLRAVGLQATVSLPIPPRSVGPGKVVLIVAGRRVEWPAIQDESALPDVVIAAGTPVHVVDASDDTTLTVVSLPRLS
ncbi:MAG TPA: hypothetical protein VKA54_18000 [Gemmatimonadaceae bacterium]|nr:hypothetical protein [Gemmatimonadaceae bacterium]